MKVVLILMILSLTNVCFAFNYEGEITSYIGKHSQSNDACEVQLDISEDGDFLIYQEDTFRLNKDSDARLQVDCAEGLKRFRGEKRDKVLGLCFSDANEIISLNIISFSEGYSETNCIQFKLVDDL